MDNFLDSPCVCCGYNGQGYWQKKTHNYYCPFHDIGGVEDRIKKLKYILRGFREPKLPPTFTANY